MLEVFELVKTILDANYKQLGANADTRIKQALTDLSSFYRNLTSTKPKPPNYSDPAVRFAYIFTYVPAHARILEDCVRPHIDTQKRLISDRLQVTAVGGGPGSELIGLHNQITGLPEKQPDRVRFYVLDKEQGWLDAWTDIEDALETDLRLSSHIVNVNASDPSSWSRTRNYRRSSIFTLSYLVSELFADKANTEGFLEDLLDSMEPGSELIYIDNAHSTFRGWFDSILSRRRISPSVSRDDVLFRVPHYDQIGVLQEYIDRFEHTPRINAKYDLRIVVKD